MSRTGVGEQDELENKGLSSLHSSLSGMILTHFH